MSDHPTPIAADSSALAVNPLLAIQQAAQASLMDYATSSVVETFGHYEAEYAVLRKGVGVFDASQKGLVKVTGADRADFLHRFVTQEVKALAPGQVKRAFLLTRPGRIAADMFIIAQADQHLLLLDRSDAQSLVNHLEKFLFTEDVKLENLSETQHVISVHGPQAVVLLHDLGGEKLHELDLLSSTAVELAGVPVVVVRTDLTGSLGLDLVMDLAHAPTVYNALLEVTGGLTPEVQGGVRRRVTGRGVGWMALNTARIEAGRPIFHIDFGPDSLPHESGVLAATVSFTKGCYLGQEIVVRMQSLGHPKKMLVGLDFEDDRLPLAGSQVFDEDGTTLIGAITSSCLSPLKGNQAIALAMMKWGKHKAGVKVKVTAEGELVNAVVCEHKL